MYILRWKCCTVVELFIVFRLLLSDSADGHQLICVFTPIYLTFCYQKHILSCACLERPCLLWSATFSSAAQQLLVALVRIIWLEICKKNLKIITRRSASWGGSLEISSSHVYGEYFKLLGKLTWGAYLCARCRTENTVDVFKSMSQVVVRLTDRPALWGLLDLRWHRGQYGSQN